MQSIPDFGHCILRSRVLAHGRDATMQDDSEGPGAVRRQRAVNATAVLTLAEVERMRLAERGEDDGWTAALRKVELRLRTERAISGEPGGRQ